MAEDPNGVSARKQALRATIRRARASLDEAAAAEAAAAIVARLRSLPELQSARVVALYAATADEVDVSGLLPWLHERDVRTLYPRVVDEGLELSEVTDPGRLRVGFRGIMEPSGMAVGAEVVDVALVPGVAFDPHGGRLGRGSGHFDRLLGSLGEHATLIGVAFSLQVVPVLPVEEHDVHMDIVVTERAVHRAPSLPPDQGA